MKNINPMELLSPINGYLVAAVALALVLLLFARAQGAELLSVGSTAPAFALPNQDGNTIASQALRGGWWVIYFYPKDHTPGCTTEACTFRDLLDALTGEGVKVFGVSFDSVRSHQSFAEKYHLSFDLLADPQGRVVNAYHAASLIPKIARRVSYLVDPEGVIRKVYPNVTPSEHAADIILDVRELRGTP